MIFRKGELFNGPGGMSLGAMNARIYDTNGNEVLDDQNEPYRIIHEWSNDYDEYACETFRQNICPDRIETVHAGPVQELDIKTLPDIEAFCFGFPCNDFSLVGEKKGTDGEFGPLYSYGVKVLKKHQPRFFVAENVSGLQSANEGYAFVRILMELEECGYTLTPHLYKFEEYGVPQARHRIIIVGIKNKEVKNGIQYRIPKPTHLGQYVTSSKAINNPPIPDTASNNEPTRHAPRVVEMLKHIPAGKNAWCDEIPQELRLNVKGAKLSQIYKRLDPDQPAYTVTGSGGGGTHVYHWAEPRALTNRERARLQTFPDDFIFYGSKEKVRKQIGMAVPPKGAQVIFEAILKSFAGMDYETDPRGPKWTMEELKKKLHGKQLSLRIDS